MQRLVLSLIATSLAVPAAQLSIDLVTDCSGGLGRATLRWQAEGPVEIRVGAPDGPAMTGLEPATGQTQTGYWVRDGMLFVLVEAGGREVARAQASLVCGGSPGVQAALARGAYFPLETGNQWVFRVNSRAVTSTYVTWTVARSDRFEDRAYAVIASGTVERWFREDEQGRVWSYFSPMAAGRPCGSIRVPECDGLLTRRRSVRLPTLWSTGRHQRWI